MLFPIVDPIEGTPEPSVTNTPLFAVESPAKAFALVKYVSLFAPPPEWEMVVSMIGFKSFP